MTHQNQLLAAVRSLAADARLEPALQPVSFKQGEYVRRGGEPCTHCYFPLSCLFAITLTLQDGATAAVGLVGKREMLGISALLGNCETTQTDCVVQLAGDALQIKAQVLRQAFNDNGELRDLLLRYMQTVLAQVAQTAACNAHHTLKRRLARWLLEVQARVHSADLPLTHEALALMLGARRAGVTLAAQRLQTQQLIHYHRGSLQILNQAGLEASACECFQATKAQYEQLFGT